MDTKVGHAIERTSPKGGEFIGKCVNCGAENLRMEDALVECPNPKQLTREQLIIDAIKKETA